MKQPWLDLGESTCSRCGAVRRCYQPAGPRDIRRCTRPLCCDCTRKWDKRQLYQPSEWAKVRWAKG